MIFHFNNHRLQEQSLKEAFQIFVGFSKLSKNDENDNYRYTRQFNRLTGPDILKYKILINIFV